MDSLSRNKGGGLSLIFGTAGMTIFSIFEPGAALIDAADATDLGGMSKAMADNATISHLTATAILFSAMLLFYGFIQIWLATAAGESMSHTVRLGVVVGIFAVCCLAMTRGLNHIIVHLVVHGAGPEADQQAQESAALAVQAVKFGLRYAAVLLTPLSLLLLGLGLAPRFPVGSNRIAARSVAAISAVAVVAMLVIEHVHEVDTIQFYRASRYLTPVAFIWLIILGVGMYRGRGVGALTPTAAT